MYMYIRIYIGLTTAADARDIGTVASRPPAV